MSPLTLRREAGGSSVLVAAAIGALAAMGAAAALVIGAVAAGRQAQWAADLSALAGAAAIQSGDQACPAAGEVARLNAGALVNCAVGADQSVTVEVSVAGRAALLGPAAARARAGPAP